MYSKLLFFCLFSFSLFAQTPQQKIPSKTRILLILDGSGSMNAPWDGSLRIDIAKKRLAALIDSMKTNKDVDFALRVYGHQFDRKQQNCKDSKLEIGFKTGNHTQLIGKLMAIQPKGLTPIAYSLLEATKDFPNDPNGEYRNVIILMTDGLESCKGDPCKISTELQKKGIFLKPFIIGLGVGQDFGKAFDCLGKAFDARNSQDFQQILGKIVRQTIGKTTVTVELLDINGQPKETNLNMTFTNKKKKKNSYQIIHFRDSKGKTDTLAIDPLLSYDLTVNTIPQVVKKNIEFEGGKHNLVQLKTPQGSLKIQMKSWQEYGTFLPCAVREAGKNDVIHHQKIGDKENYLVGKYDIEVFTTPRTYLKNVAVKQSELTEIEIAQAGLLTIRSNFEGYATILLQKSETEQEFVKNIDITDKSISVPLQPNAYKLVFRAKDALGSIFTVVKSFEIKSGQANSVTVTK